MALCTVSEHGHRFSHVTPFTTQDAVWQSLPLSASTPSFLNDIITTSSTGKKVGKKTEKKLKRWHLRARVLEHKELLAYIPD